MLDEPKISDGLIEFRIRYAIERAPYIRLALGFVAIHAATFSRALAIFCFCVSMSMS